VIAVAVLPAVCAGVADVPAVACSSTDMLLVQHCLDDTADDVCGGSTAAFVSCVSAAQATRACTASLVVRRLELRAQAGCDALTSTSTSRRVRGVREAVSASASAQLRELQSSLCSRTSECFAHVVSAAGGPDLSFGFRCGPMLDAVNCFLNVPSLCWSSYVDVATLRQSKVPCCVAVCSRGATASSLPCRHSPASSCSPQADLEACVALPPPNSPGGCPLDTLRDTMECADQLNLDDADFAPGSADGTVCTLLSLVDTCLDSLPRVCYAAQAGRSRLLFTVAPTLHWCCTRR
jgi:hypothetical protein